MLERFEKSIYCPYCGESISVLVDAEFERQQYVEDCQVCCRPITLVVTQQGEDVEVTAHDEDEPLA